MVKQPPLTHNHTNVCKKINMDTIVGLSIIANNAKLPKSRKKKKYVFFNVEVI